MRRFAALVLVVAAAVPFVGSTARAGADDPWLGLLERLPDTADVRSFVVLNDYDAAAEVVDVEGGGSKREKLVELTLNGGMAPSELLQTIGRGDALKKELGIPAASIEREALGGNQPDAILVLEGDVDRDAVDEATAADGTWSDLRKEREYKGQSWYQWDGDRLYPDRITPVRRLGRGGRLAVEPPYAVWTNTDQAMKASLATTAGDEPSLADDRDVRAVVEALQEAGAYTMVLTDEPPSEGADTGGPEPLVTPELMALGATADEGEPGLVIVLEQANGGDASENAERLQAIVDEGISSATRAPWNERLQVDDITTDGDLVIAKLSADSPRLWFQIVLTRDSLIATE